MFDPVYHDDRLIGHARYTKTHVFFFGTGAADRETLRARFSDYRFAWMRQVHGRAVVEADASVEASADAHVTGALGLALGVVTADCVPVLLASRRKIAGVHAGWRGIEADVIGAALATFAPDDPVIEAAIGPHLSFESFEVGEDVARRLRATAPKHLAGLTRPHADPRKQYVDLFALARAQILAHAPAAHVARFTPDTQTSSAYHSYRRSGAGAGRNLSFVVRLA